MKRILLGLLMLAGLIAPAHATCTLPYQLQNGKIADANQVMANMNAIVACIVDQGPGGLNDQVQYNNFGAFGGLTDVALTARIQPFTASLNGAVPAPITPQGFFLEDNGTWAAAGGCSGSGTDVLYTSTGSDCLGTDAAQAFTVSGTPVIELNEVDGANFHECCVTADTDVALDLQAGSDASGATGGAVNIFAGTGTTGGNVNIATGLGASGQNRGNFNLVDYQGNVNSLSDFTLGSGGSLNLNGANEFLTTAGTIDLAPATALQINGNAGANCPSGVTAGTVVIIDGIVTHC